MKTRFFKQEALLTLKEFAIDPYDTVFYKPSLVARVKPLSEFFYKAVKKGGDIDILADMLAGKLAEKNKHALFICRLCLTDGLYAFAPPEPLQKSEEQDKNITPAPKGIAKYIAETEKKLLAINNSHTRKLMASAKKNAEFIERFNKELFFKHSFYQGRRITAEELFDFYETHPYYQIINLSSDADKQPFIALYAMSFYACSPKDLFTIDGIFSMQPERHSDNAKKTAGNCVFNLILRNDKAEIEKVVLQMGQTLSDIQPPRVNLSDAVMLAKNYTMFAGLAEMARVFIQVASDTDVGIIPQETLNSVKTLMRYAPLVALCDTISVLSDYEDYRDTVTYKKCKDIF